MSGSSQYFRQHRQLNFADPLRHFYERMAGGASYAASKLKFLCLQYSSVLFLRNGKVFFKNVREDFNILSRIVSVEYSRSFKVN